MDQIIKKKVTMEFIRKDRKTFFKFEIPSELEQIYKRMSGEIKTSLNWPGLQFYSIPTLLNNKDYIDLISNYNLIDSYGSKLFDKSNTFNIAWIRTVGGKGEIEITEMNKGFAELGVFCRNTITFLKKHIETHFKDFTVKGELTLEI